MSVNVRYNLLHVVFWAEYLVLTGYCTYFLGEYGFSDTAIGAINSGFAAVSIILTFILGRLADHNPKWNWKAQGLVMSVIIALMLLILVFVKIPMVIGIFFGFMFLVLLCLTPMVYAASFYYEAKNIKVNFGIARGIGSASYALTSTIVGRLTASIGRDVLPVCGVVVGILMIVAFLALPYDGPVEMAADNANTAVENKKSDWLSVLFKYPALTCIMLANFLLLVFHNMYCSYIIRIIERVGGDSGDMGIALAIGAMCELPMMFASSKLIKNIPAYVMLMVAPLGFVLRGALFILATSVGGVYIAQITSMIGYAVYASVGVYFANNCVEQEDMVTGQAMFSMSISAASILSGIVGGWLTDSYGIVAMLNIGIVIAICGGLSAVAAGIIYKRTRKCA